MLSHLFNFLLFWNGNITCWLMTSMSHIRHNKFIKNEVCITTARHFIHFLDLNSSTAYSKKKMEKNETVPFIPTRFVITIFQLQKQSIIINFSTKYQKRCINQCWFHKADYITNLNIRYQNYVIEFWMNFCTLISMFC